MCSQREDIRDFEWNGLNLTSTKREEVQRETELVGLPTGVPPEPR